METNVNYVIFDKLECSSSTEEILPPELDNEIMRQFLESGYFSRNTLPMDKFLDEDRTIDLEKLELALALAVEYLEFFMKSDEPIYIFIRDMDKYFESRAIKRNNIERITEESSFILGFCNSIVQELSSKGNIIVQFKPSERPV